jgi:hypothetical protein
MGVTKDDFDSVIGIHDDGSKELDAGLRPLDHYKQVLFLSFIVLISSVLDTNFHYGSRSCLSYDGRHRTLQSCRYLFLYWLHWDSIVDSCSLQAFLRSPALDFFFVQTANVGWVPQLTLNWLDSRTHTFFLIGLPVLHWLGQPAVTCRFRFSNEISSIDGL